jgi:signal transduction histidine kinase
LQDKVFDRFQQVDSSDATRKGGSGLGLAICKSIIEQHQGHIGVESCEGEGSCFWFQIPLAQKPSATAIQLAEATETGLLRENPRAEERA